MLERDSRVNKRALTILLVVLAVVATIWLANILGPQSTETLTQAQSQRTSGLVSLDGAAKSDDASATATETATPADETQSQPQATAAIDEAGTYTTKEDVGLYLYTYGYLPQNFITKNDARALGWSGGGLDDYAYGKCIGGDRFGNNEGLLPEASGRQYYECDIDTLHEDSRGAKRIVFSSDGLIYYTEDHYESFDLLYGEP